ncbi:MAG TPA: hypothetical protein VIC84_18950 [Blastocatellia bacterium]|jgi:hypothetical protein
MTKKVCLLLLSFNILCAINGRARAQASTTPAHDAAVVTSKAEDPAPSKSNIDLNREIEELRHRVEDLENQNRALAELLNAVKTRLAALPEPAQLDERSAARSLPAAAPPRASDSTEIAAAKTATETPAGPPAAEKTAQAKPAESDQPLHWSDILGSENKFKLYGFLRLDVDYDSQRANSDQGPLFITSADPRIGAPHAEDFSMHPRLSRFGIDYSGPRIAALGDSKLSGKFEIDFENGGSESRQIIRIRQGYLKMDWDNHFSILAGQTWDVVSPLFPTVNNDTLMWNAGNVGDRRPQFRATWEPKIGQGQWSFSGAAGLMGAIDAQDLDNNGYRDGEESGRPNAQGRIGYAHSSWVKDQRASLGFSGFYGLLNTTRPIAGRTSFHSQLANIDYTLPLSSRLSLRGEGWWGRNMSDVRGGAGQGINTTNGREIRGRGGWSELSLKISRYWSFHPGYTTDDPVDADVPTGGRIRNRAYYFGNRITPGGNFLLGFDYLRWLTDYKGFLPGESNRINIFLQYNF